MTKLIIFCARPGMHRGGQSHPTIKTHALNAFTSKQLAELEADPNIFLAIGEPADAEDIEVAAAAAEEAAYKAAAGKKA